MLPGAHRSGPFHETKPSDDPKLFGTEIGKFHKAMRDALLVDRMAVVMDLRHSHGVDHSQVWNQAIYRYEAHYWETLPHNDRLDIQVRTHLNANDDRLNDDRSSSGLPAKIVNGPKPGGTPHSAEPDTAAIRRDQTLRYHVKFQDDGDIDASNSINEWLGVKLDGASPELHAPRYIMSPKKPIGNSAPDGNIKIDPADVLAVLPLRDRFK
jgi:hypothetical protein